MGGEVTVYSGAPMLGAADAGMLGISWKLRPGMPTIILDISLDIIEEEDELEKEDEDVLLEEEFMLIDPIFDIIFPIMSSMPSDGMPPIPPIDIISGIPPIIMPPGIGPPEDIIVEDEDEEEEDLKLDMVDPSSD